MQTLYVVSQDKSAGKSALCAGLGRHFQANGLTIGYMKPVSTQVRHVAGHLVDEDAELLRRLFHLDDDLDEMAPILLEANAIQEVLRGFDQAHSAKLEEAFEALSDDKDIMLMESGGDLAEGSLIGLPPKEIAERTGAKTLLVAKYESDLVVDCVLAAKERLGDTMLGCVINMVPSRRMSFVQEVLVPFLTKRDVPVFGVFRHEPMLLAVSVQELADTLGGEVLCAQACVDELVEDVMIGAMSVESALRFFRRKTNKAVITGGDRPDIQLAALGTSTECLILTGNLHPSPLIMERANELGVPIVLVRQDTLTAMRIVERFFGRSRFHQRQKFSLFEEIMEKQFDFEALYNSLNLET
jgi:hypothetical protein